MKRKGAPAKDGKCPRDAPKDEKCDNCRSKKGACLVTARIAAGNASPSPDEPSTSKPRPTQPVADSDMDIDPINTRPSRQCQPPERFEVDANITSRATGQRWAAHSCCQNHMDAEPSTSEPAPKPKFTGPMDKYLSDKRVEAAVNRAVKSITDNPADLERELRAFAQTGEDWRQKSMTLEQEKEAIQKKLEKVYHGRFPNDARAAYRAVHQAAATDYKEPLRARVLCTKRALRDTARLFEMSPQTLEQSRDRFAYVVFEHFAEPQGKMRKERVRPLSSLLAVRALRAQVRALHRATVP